MTDEELFNLFKDGRQDAFAKLYDRYHGPLTRYIAGRTKFDQLTCDDIIQRVFLQVNKNKNEFVEGKLLRPWIYTIADYIVVDFQRASARWQRKHRSFSDYSNAYANGSDDERDEIVRLVDESAENPEDTLSDTELGEKAMKLVRRLPKSLRHAVQMQIINGIPSRAAGPLLGISYRQAQTRMHMALDVLRKQLEDGVKTPETELTADCTIRELVDTLPDDEHAAVDRVIYNREGFDDNDLAIFATFLRRLVGEAV